jgi:hypothetical protein
MYLILEYAIHVVVDMSAEMLDTEARRTTYVRKLSKKSKRPRGLRETLVHEKNLKSRISWQTPYNDYTVRNIIIARYFIYVKIPE